MRFASLVLDVDSTLCGIEGIDWLAQRRGGDVAARARELTDRAMNGEIPLDNVYGERLLLIRPNRADIDALARIYRQTMAEGAADAIAALKAAGVRVVLVSGGIRQAISALARELGVELHAVELQWNAEGEFADFDRTSPLTTQHGKLDVVRSIALPRPVLAAGDGATDVAMKPAVDRFVAFTGFSRRVQVVQQADAEVADFHEIQRVTLGQD